MADRRTPLRRGNTYETHVAALRAVQMYVNARVGRDGVIELRREDARVPAFDDLVETIHTSDGVVLQAWQVRDKVSMTDEEVATLLVALKEHSDFLGILAVSGWPSVGKRSIQVLGALCQAARDDMDVAAYLRSRPREQRDWLDHVCTSLASEAEVAVSWLRRFTVRHLGPQAQVDEQALHVLTHEFPQSSVAALHSVLLTRLDEVVGHEPVTPDMVHRWLHPTGGPVPLHGLGGARAQHLARVRNQWSALQPLNSTAENSNWQCHHSLASVFVEPVLRRNSDATDDSDTLTPAELIDRVAAFPRWAIVGDVGTGKSTLLAWLAQMMCSTAESNPSAPLPLFISARTLLARGWPSVLDDARPDHRLREYRERWALLVDGIDEAGPAAWSLLSRLVAQGSLGGSQPVGAEVVTVVASTRPTTMPGEADGFQLAHLDPWSELESHRYFDAWKRHAPDAVARLRRSLSPDSDIFRVPLTATAALLLANRNQNVSRHRAALLANTIDCLIEDWRRGRTYPVPSTADVRELLSALALAFLTTGPISVDNFERECAKRGYRLARGLQDEVERHLGVLVREGDHLVFALRSIAEHLAGDVVRTVPESSADFCQIASTPWGREVARHALGLDAYEEKTDRLNAHFESLRLEAKRGTVDVGALRCALTAIDSAADIEGATSAALSSDNATGLALVVTHLLLEEESAWVGDIVAEKTRRLAISAGPSWTCLLQNLLAHASASSVDAVHWYTTRAGTKAIALRGLLHRDANVRAACVDGLAPHFVEPDVWRLLLFMIQDEGHTQGGAAPALRAGLHFRNLPRTEDIADLATELARIVRVPGQLTPGSAALALLPDEAPAPDLARSLFWLSSAYDVPRHVVEALDATPAGHDALEAAWPGWREKVVDDLERPVYRGVPSALLPAPSAVARIRLVRACGPQLANLSPEHRNALADRTPEHLSRELIASGEIEAALSARLDRITVEDQRILGELVLRSPDLRQHIIDAWATWPDWGIYPGVALEPLIELGDEHAANVYSEWLPRSPYNAGLIRLTPPSRRVLRHPRVQTVAQALLLDVVRKATERATDGTRLSETAAATVCAHFAHAWDDAEVVARIVWRFLSDDVDDGVLAVLIALRGREISEAAEAELVERLRRRLSGESIGPSRVVHLDRELRFVDVRGWAHLLEEVLIWLSQLEGTTGWQALAVLWPLLGEDERARASARIAAESCSHILYSLPQCYLPRLVAAAPEVWSQSIERAIKVDTRLEATVATSALQYLPRDLQSKVVRALSTSGVSQLELPWRTRGDGFSCARLGDMFRKLQFELDL